MSLKLTFKKRTNKNTKNNPNLSTFNVRNIPDLILYKILGYCGKDVLAMLYDISPYMRNIIRGKDSTKMVKYINSCNIYENQWKAAEKICNQFINGIHYVLLTAQPQSGKTGTCQAVCYLVRELKDKLNITNYWFLCGMNDNNLKKQQTNEFKGLIDKNNILFSKDMQLYKPRNNNDDYFKNSLIILDESHYAQTALNSKQSMVHQFLTKFVGITLDGIENKWKGTNLWFLSVSATPMSELVHFLRPINYNDELIELPKAKVQLDVTPKYYGFQRMFELNRIHQSFNIAKPEERQLFVDILTKHYNLQKTKNQYKYVLIRFSNTGHGDDYRQAVQQQINFPIKYIHFHSKFMQMNDINNIVSKPPDTFTIIEVYHSLRAGIQLNTQNICLVHDTYRANTDVTAQGLAGRCCGYNKEHHNVDIYCFKDRLSNYISLIDNNFDPNFVPSHCYNVKHGYSPNLNDKFKSDIPMGGQLDSEMINRIQQLKNESKQYAVKFQQDGYLDEIREMDFINKELWDQTTFVGITILDDKNKTEGNTTTWLKFWDPAYKAFTNKKPGSYFKHSELPDDVHHFKYIFINVKPDHPQFGHILITSKHRFNDDNPSSYIITTGKEQFHPNNNADRTIEPDVITFKKKKPIVIKYNKQKILNMFKSKSFDTTIP